MSGQWGRFVTALRFFTRIPVPTIAGAENLRPSAGARFLPLVGVLIGAIGAGAYWLAAQVWPASVAVVLSMLATVLITGGIHERGFSRERMTDARDWTPDARERTPDVKGTSFPGFGALGMLFVLLIKYNALMALSAANLAFPLPEYLALGVIMISGHAASRALAVSVIATHTQTSLRVSSGDLILALIIGFAPAALLGIPGLMGLAAAILVRIAFAAYAKRRFSSASDTMLDAVQQLTEICFYLGALATWAYV